MQNYTISPTSPIGALKFSHSMEFSPYALDSSLHRVPSLPITRSYTLCQEIDYRAGRVLTHNMILKTDKFPIDKKARSGDTASSGDFYGVHTFRYLSNTNVYGMAQPPIYGIRSILNSLNAKRSVSPRRSVIWINLREEPVIYLNEMPHVLRDAKSPMENIRDYSGITPESLNDMELRLKDDIINESLLHHGNITIHSEKNYKEILPRQISVVSPAILTLYQCFQVLSIEGYDVEYHRMPITPEQVPDNATYDALLSLLKNSSPDIFIIFNCQTGYFRSSHMMIISASIQHWRRMKNKLIPSVIDNDMINNFNPDEGEVGGIKNFDLLKGYYKPIRDLIQMLPEAEECKKLVDLLIQKDGPSSAIMKMIYDYRQKAIETRIDSQAKGYLLRATKYLRHYFYLIVFNCYLYENWQDDFKVSFSSWMKDHSEIYSIDNIIQNQSDLAVDTNINESLIKDLLHRNGSVLNNTMILLHDNYCKDVEYENENENIKVSSFRTNLSGNIIGSACPTYSGAKSLFENIQNSIISVVNLRASPLIYMKGDLYILSDINHPHQYLEQYRGLRSDLLEQSENRLRDDIIQEISQNNNQILVHIDDGQCKLSEYYLSITEDEILTPKMFYEKINQEFSNKTIDYYRIPNPPGGIVKDKVIDLFLNVLNTIPQSSSIYFVCQKGTGRSEFAMALTSLVRYSTAREKEVDLEIIVKDDVEASYNGVQSLIRLFPNGYFLHSLTNKAIRDSSPPGFYSLLDDLIQSVESFPQSVPHINHVYSRYLLLIISAAYLNEKPNCSFKEWKKNRPEITKIYEDVLYHVEENIKSYKLSETVPSIETDESSIHHGVVLNKTSIIKNDHFVGCRNPLITPVLEGAPNFRHIGLNEIPVYGTAIPTIQGIFTILKIYWINLREEPLIYINNRPYALRNKHTPFTNIEYTGITCEKVEDMEKRLKQELLTELSENDNALLLHEEDGMMSDICKWIPSDVNSILTCQDIFGVLVNQQQINVKCNYHRIPVTDEQAPLPVQFDMIFNCVMSAPTDMPCIFNCQMGRGRTTTGMILGALVKIWLMKKCDDYIKKYETQQTATILNGYYDCVSRLLRVLENGLKAKMLLDLLINNCSAMQNLRETISDYYRQSLDTNLTEKKRKTCSSTANGFLRRYYYLIVFAGYLLSYSPGETIPAFSVWLQNRPEITNVEFSLHQ